MMLNIWPSAASEIGENGVSPRACTNHQALIGHKYRIANLTTARHVYLHPLYIDSS
jgi:hypothetical protein